MLLSARPTSMAAANLPAAAAATFALAVALGDDDDDGDSINALLHLAGSLTSTCSSIHVCVRTLRAQFSAGAQQQAS